MKKFEALAFDYALCRQQVEELQAWLASKAELSERDDILPFFRARPHLAVLFGMFNTRIGWADRIAWEFDIFGDFACDLVVGEWATGRYCFIEFEDARSNSVFQRQGTKATRDWGRRFDHGYSQIIDWIHKLNDRSLSYDFLARFGQHEINYETVLVIGRDQHLDAGEKQRLNWRSENVVVNTKKVVCLTFDQLLDRFVGRLGILSGVVEKLVAEATKAAAAAKAPEGVKGTDPSSEDASSVPAKPPENEP